MIIIHGTKVRRLQVGLVALDCPQCGNRVVADVTQVQTSKHLYYVPLGWKDEGVYLTCRRCLSIGRLQLGMRTVTGMMESDDEPSPELIQASNPRMPAEPPPPLPLQPALPPEVTREQWALLTSMLELDREAKANFDGHAGAVVLVGLIVAPIVGVAVAGARHDVGMGWGAALSIIAVVVVGALRMRQYLGRGELNLRVGTALMRHCRRTGTEPGHVIVACHQLGKPYHKLLPYLRWLRDRAARRRQPPPRLPPRVKL